MFLHRDPTRFAFRGQLRQLLNPRFSPLALLLFLALPGDLRAQDSTAATDIVIGSAPLHTGMIRPGINISGQSYYDSGQMLRNLIYRNPGFEGEQVQVLVQCDSGSTSTCVDGDNWSAWPDNFANGASFEVITGAAAGQTGTIKTQTAAHPNPVFTFASPLSVPIAHSDMIAVRMLVPGNPGAGWWTGVQGGATITAEYSDIPVNSPGKQAARLTAASDGQSATVTQYFDSWDG
jgi:hypothetical protein